MNLIDGHEIGLIKQSHSLNQLLAKDPDAEIPEYFSKIKKEELVLEYKLSERLDLDESHRVCYEIMHDLLKESIKISLIEPIAKIQKVTKVRQKAPLPQKDKLTLRKMTGATNLIPIEKADYSVDSKLNSAEGQRKSMKIIYIKIFYYL